MFLGKRSERVSMSLTTMQATVMLISGTLVAANNELNVDFSHKEVYFSFSLVVISIILAFLSFCYRPIALFFACISASYAITWTLMYCSTVLFGSRVAFGYLALANLVVSLAILFTCWYYPTFREAYSYRVYTSITHPFFFCMAVSIYFDVYLDIVNFNQYRSWGKVDRVTWKGWIFLVLQLVLTKGFLIKAIKWDIPNRLRSTSNFKNLAETFRMAKNECRGSEFDPDSRPHSYPQSPQKSIIRVFM